MTCGKTCIVNFCFPVNNRTIYFYCSIEIIGNKKDYSFSVDVLNGYKGRDIFGKYPIRTFIVKRERFFKDLKIWCKKFNVYFCNDEALK